MTTAWQDLVILAAGSALVVWATWATAEMVM